MSFYNQTFKVNQNPFCIDLVERTQRVRALLVAEYDQHQSTKSTVPGQVLDNLISNSDATRVKQVYSKRHTYFLSLTKDTM